METIKLLSAIVSTQVSTEFISGELNGFSFRKIQRNHHNNWTNSFQFTFKIEFRPDHIQLLKNLGVKFEIPAEAKDGKRYIPSNSPNGYLKENWVTSHATCDFNTLIKLDRICRENHLRQIAIHNDHTLRGAGFEMIKERNKSNPSTEVLDHVARIESIRKEVRKHPKKFINVYTKRCAVKKLDY